MRGILHNISFLGDVSLPFVGLQGALRSTRTPRRAKERHRSRSNHYLKVLYGAMLAEASRDAIPSNPY